MRKTKQETKATQSVEVKKTKLEWIESAGYLKAERFEVAGALFDTQPEEQLGESAVKQKLQNYKDGGQ